MKIRRTIQLCGVLALFGVGCIKNEPLNMEADITAVHINQSDFNTEPIVTNNLVTIYVKPGIYDLTKYAFTFDVSHGAIAQPASGTPEDFTKPVTYTITSQDGKWKKQYTVTIVQSDESSVPTNFGFENFSVNPTDKYTVFYDMNNGVNLNNWASGNAAIALLVNPKVPSNYPTTDTTYSHSGKYAARLVTQSTGFFGSLVKKPIAAGNLFIGSFNTNLAYTNSLLATQFGLPFNKIPTSLEGYYTYQAGKTVTDSLNKPVPNMTDSCDIYAVLYNRETLQNETGKTVLDGYNILTSSSIVAIARLENGSSTSATKDNNGFTRFSVPFKFIKTYNEQDAYSFKYNIALVFSSSRNGAYFQGAVGSLLVVDDVKINTK